MPPKKKTVEEKPSVDVDALVAQNQALMDQVRQMAENNSKLLEQVTQLTLASIAAREAPGQSLESDEDRPSVVVENTSNYSIGFEVTDPRTGTKRLVRFDKKGQKTKLWKEQVEALRVSHKHWFDKGYLSAPEFVEDNPNVIRDVEAFIDSLELDTVDDAIESITSKDTLFGIYHYIQGKRFTHVDAHGNPIVKEVAGRKVFSMEENKVDVKLRAVELAAQRRLMAITDVLPKLDG